MPSLMVTQIAALLDEVGSDAAEMFERNLAELTQAVEADWSSRAAEIWPGGDARLFSQPAHAAYMASQFALPSPQSFVATMTRWHREGLESGAPAELFAALFEIWRRTIERRLPPAEARPIAALYAFLADHHGEFVCMAQTATHANPIDSEHLVQYSQFLDHLLAPDAEGAVRQTMRAIHTLPDLVVWWEHILQPALYQIGHMWAQGEITVGQEHMATAIVRRVMAVHYPLILDQPKPRGRIIVAATPGELHEIGPLILADLLEINGWNVTFIGSNPPQDSLIAAVQTQRPDYLCLSTTLYRHLPLVRNVLTAMRERIRDQACPLIVGGQAYHADPALWQQIGADMYCESASAAVSELCSEVEPS